MNPFNLASTALVPSLALSSTGIGLAAPPPANAPEKGKHHALISKKLKKTPLHQIARATLFNHFSSSPKRLTEMVKEFDITPDQKIARGLFVTLYKDGKTRACWGSISPRQADLVSATVYTTVDCLTKEYRYPPVKASELEDLKAQVTIVEKVEPVRSGATLHPLTDGLMVRSGGKGAVLLPGEASCPHYQVMQCKLKAGINPRESCQLYRIKAHVIR